MLQVQNQGNNSKNPYDWYQSDTHVTLNVMIKNLTEDDVSVKLIDETLDISAQMEDGSQFNLHFDLFKKIMVDESSWTVTPTKLEIKLKKLERKRWQSLQVMSSAKPTKRGSNLQSNQAVKKVNITPIVVDNTYVVAEEKTGQVTYDWYQTESTVSVNVMLPNLREDETDVTFEPKCVRATIRLPDASQYNMSIPLFKEINVDESTYQVTKDKLNLLLVKGVSRKWQRLEEPLTETDEAVTSLDPFLVEERTVD